MNVANIKSLMPNAEITEAAASKPVQDIVQAESIPAVPIAGNSHSTESIAGDPLPANQSATITDRLAEESTLTVQPQIRSTRLMIKPTFAIKARRLAKRLIPATVALLVIYLIWAWAAHHIPGLPSPYTTWQVAMDVFKQPFYGENAAEPATKPGLGWHVLSSLKNVLLGFILAAAAGIPLGFMIGKYQFMSRMIGLVISLFKPVSPLAWLPIGLLVFKTADLAAISVVFLSAIWPIMINTAMGVSKAPSAYINVGKMLNLSEWEIISKILFPYALPNMMNGLRLAIGIAWLVIVAVEMLKSDGGIGFWILNAWQQSDYARILIGILMIGMIGFLLESLLKLINKRAFSSTKLNS